MEKKYLKSMVESVKEQKQILKFEPLPTNEKLLDFAINVIKREELISQQPNIGMFVPAVCENGVWRVLEEPKHLDYKQKNQFNELVFISEHHKNRYCDEYEQYQQAQSKVIFKGFEIVNKNFCQFITDGKCYAFYKEDNDKLQQWKTEIHTLEDLVKFNLELI